MEEYTPEEIAGIFKAAGDSVTVINGTKTEEETDAHWKDRVKRNVEHLEFIKAYKHENGSSIWTSEDFTDIDAAIVKGKTFYGG